MTQLLAFAVLGVAAALGGCALTTEKIDVEYRSVTSPVRVPGADTITVNVAISDQRQDKSRVSSKKNGFGMEMAPILANEDPAITIRKAIEQEITARGFRLGPDSASVQIAGDLTRFYNDHKVGFFAGDAVAELDLQIQVRAKDGRQLFSRSVVAEGTEPNTQLMNGKNAKRALDRALSNGMKLLFDDPAFLASLSASTAAPPVAEAR